MFVQTGTKNMTRCMERSVANKNISMKKYAMIIVEQDSKQKVTTNTYIFFNLCIKEIYIPFTPPDHTL